MALPELLKNSIAKEKNFVFSMMNKKHNATVDTEKYSLSLRNAFVYSVLEQLKDIPDLSDVEKNNRQSLIDEINNSLTSSGFGVVLAILFDNFPMFPLKTVRRIGFNLILVNVSRDSFPDDTSEFEVVESTLYTLANGVWGDGQDLIIYDDDDSLLVIDNFSVGQINGIVV